MKTWTRDDVFELARSYQAASVLTAAADLDLFRPLSSGAATAEQLAGRLGADRRGTTVLLDALAAIGILEKKGERYALSPGIEHTLGQTGPGGVLAMVQHQASCMRRWSRVAETVKTGRPRERTPSVRGATADREAFLLGMNDLTTSTADGLVAKLGPPQFRCLLDVGGASGTWTIAFRRGVSRGACGPVRPA